MLTSPVLIRVLQQQRALHLDFLRRGERIESSNVDPIVSIVYTSYRNSDVLLDFSQVQRFSRLSILFNGFEPHRRMKSVQGFLRCICESHSLTGDILTDAPVPPIRRQAGAHITALYSWVWRATRQGFGASFRMSVSQKAVSEGARLKFRSSFLLRLRSKKGVDRSDARSLQSPSSLRQETPSSTHARLYHSPSLVRTRFRRTMCLICGPKTRIDSESGTTSTFASVWPFRPGSIYQAILPDISELPAIMPDSRVPWIGTPLPNQR